MTNTLEQMRRDLAMAGYATGTQKSYLKTATWMQQTLGAPIEELSRDQVRQFVEQIMTSDRSSSWKRVHLAAVAFVFRKTLGRPEWVSFISWPKPYSPLPTILSPQQVQQLLNGFRSPTYQAIAMVLYGAGLRLSEALALETSDIDRARSTLRVRHGKGNKAREVAVSQTLIRWLRRYWAEVRPVAPFLFTSPITGRPPIPESVRHALRGAAREAGINKPVHPHLLRHCFATHALEAGTDVRIVQAMLGHSNINTTARYARVTTKLMRKAPDPLTLLP